ncbi:MAG: plastocyanin/azurin family copper-binding protein [Gammaproteobacteria bacterium]
MKLKFVLGLTAILFSQQSYSAEFEVGQKNKQFTKSELTIKAGDSVSFPNHDPFFHNVFSLSAIKTFDLGSYAKGETKVLQFDEPGTIEVECAIHPNMQMKIIVE